MDGDQPDTSVTAIVESIRGRVARRLAGRPRTPPFDAQLINHVASMRQSADLYQAPLATGTGLASSLMAGVRKAARRILLPWIARQNAYNGANAHAVDALRDQLELVAYHQALTTEDLLDVQARTLERGQRQQDDLATLRDEVPALATVLAALRTELATLGVRTDALVPGLQAAAAQQGELRALRERVAHLERQLRRSREPGLGTPSAPAANDAAPIAPDFDYAGFEERMRGSEEEIRNRQRAYLPYFAGATRVVDLGSGRGEFLELLREAGVPGEGIELDTDMVLCTRDKGLQVTQADLRTWLAEQPPDSLGGIMSAQVLEHLPAAEVIHVVGLAHRALAPGGRLVVETVNPSSVGALTSFFVDFTHVRPLHPEAIRFLFESLGFLDVEIRFSGFVDPSAQIPEVPATPELGAAAALFNPAIRRVNGLLYGPYDYAVIGRKAGAPGA